MRLHKPVHPHHQPHLAHSFAKTDTHAGSGAGDGHGFAYSGDEHAAGGAGFHQGGIPTDSRYADGGLAVPEDSLAALDAEDAYNARQKYRNKKNVYQDTFDKEQAKNDAADDARYDAGGVVDPKSFLGWPNENPGFEDGGQVDPQQFLNPTPDANNLQTLADHANQVYTDYHKQLEQQWNTEQGGGADVTQNSSDNDADDQGFARGGKVKKADDGMGQEEYMLAQDEAKFKQMDGAEERALAEDERKQNYAEGGEVDGGIPPGPAGAGVTPQSPAGNPGRPNYIDPNADATAQKNYAQNVSARQFTSPSVGTAFSQPPPIGGQRGQEWYGKKGGAGIPTTPGGK